MDRGIAAESGLDACQEFEQAPGLDEAAAEHLLDVTHVLRMASLDLREGLRLEVVVVYRQLALLEREQTPILPAGHLRNEVLAAGCLDQPANAVGVG